jgi:hypothetical protein
MSYVYRIRKFIIFNKYIEEGDLMMTRVLQSSANGIAYLYSGLVVTVSVAMGIMAIASVATIFVSVFRLL